MTSSVCMSSQAPGKWDIETPLPPRPAPLPLLVPPSPSPYFSLWWIWVRSKRWVRLTGAPSRADTGSRRGGRTLPGGAPRAETCRTRHMKAVRRCLSGQRHWSLSCPLSHAMSCPLSWYHPSGRDHFLPLPLAPPRPTRTVHGSRPCPCPCPSSLPTAPPPAAATVAPAAIDADPPSPPPPPAAPHPAPASAPRHAHALPAPPTPPQ